MLLRILQQLHIKTALVVFLGMLALTGLLTIFVAPQTSKAQNSIRGLEISPFLMELDVAKGGSIAQTITITNRSAESLRVTATPRDFLPGNDGQPEFVPDPQINDPTFSLSSWVKFTNDPEFTIKAGETVSVPFSVNPPANAEQGTHYGAVLFSYASPSVEGNVSGVQQSVGTILLVYYGQSQENGQVNLESNKKLFWNADKVNLTTTFDNTGNVHVKPKGGAVVKNMLGQAVGSVFVNRDAANVLPKTNRSFVGAWYPSGLSFGRYTIESVITYGRSRLEARDKIVIWILPWYFDVIIAVILIILAWFALHGRHWYKRKVIKKHLGSS
jgi:hypothetical protein